MQTELEYIKKIPCLVIDLGVDDYKISAKLFAHMQNVFSKLQNAKLIIIKGSSDYFCKGMDIELLADNDITNLEIKNYLLLIKKLLELISTCPIPVIAKIDGKVLGGGLGIACAADVIIISESAEISLPETIMGILPAMIFPYISRRINPSKAKWLTLGSLPLSAQDAFSIGLVDVVSADTNAILNKYIKRLACIDQSACEKFKLLYNNHYCINNDAYYNEAIEFFIQLATSDNTKQRINKLIAGEVPWE